MRGCEIDQIPGDDDIEGQESWRIAGKGRPHCQCIGIEGGGEIVIILGGIRGGGSGSEVTQIGRFGAKGRTEDDDWLQIGTGGLGGARETHILNHQPLPGGNGDGCVIEIADVDLHGDLKSI